MLLMLMMMGNCERFLKQAEASLAFGMFFLDVSIGGISIASGGSTGNIDSRTVWRNRTWKNLSINMVLYHHRLSKYSLSLLIWQLYPIQS